MKAAFWKKDSKVPLVIDCFEVFHYKLLWINITNIDQLMKEMHTGRVSISLRSVHGSSFNRQSILKITIFPGEGKRISAVSYTTSLQEIFNMNTTDNDNELNYSNTTIDILQKVLLTVSLNMKKLSSIRWTNEVFDKFLLINNKSPAVLLCLITDGTLNPKLEATIPFQWTTPRFKF